MNARCIRAVYEATPGTSSIAVVTVRAGIVEITPAKAERMLERNTHNRAVVLSRVDQYTEDIREGRWIVNGEAIKVADDGAILDGQHRLMAVLEADASIRTVIITGLDPSTQESMDQGMPRGFHDVLKLRGEKDPNVLAAATKIVAIYERDGCPYATGSRAPISNQLAAATFERLPEIREACKRANQLRKPWMPPSNMAALHLLMARGDRARADSYFEELAGDTEADSVITAVRRRLIEDWAAPSDQPRLHIRARMAFIVYGWNTLHEGGMLPALRWSAADPPPHIAGA